MIKYEEITSEEIRNKLREYMRKNMIGAGYAQVDPDTCQPYVIIEGKNYKLGTTTNPNAGLKWD